jgi:putative copper resistance protein D
MLPAPNLSNVLWTYVPDAAIMGFLIFITALYIRGVVILAKRGDKWPIGRTIAFAFAVAATDFATSGGLGAYARFSFSYHMVAHMILGMVAPIGFVLSAPITLALRTLPIGRTSDERGIRGNLIALLHSKYFQVVSNPIVALAIFDGSLFALYMTPLFGDLMQSHFGHLFMSLHFLLAGTLFFHVIVGIDPSPKRVPYIVRIIILFAAMSIHAFFSIALMSASTLLDGGYFASLDRPWSTDLLADQKAGGAVGWAMGEIPILIALVATFIQWTRDDKKETKRIDRAEDRKRFAEVLEKLELKSPANGMASSKHKAREIAGIPIGVTSRLKPAILKTYDIFVQSTSSNRKLLGGTKFLYEVEEWTD